MIDANAMETNDDAAVQKWLWDDLDRCVLTMRFGHLKVIQEYSAAWRALRSLGLQGVYSLLRFERELLRKVRICASLFCCVLAVVQRLGMPQCATPAQLNVIVTMFWLELETLRRRWLAAQVVSDCAAQIVDRGNDASVGLALAARDTSTRNKPPWYSIASPPRASPGCVTYLCKRSLDWIV